MAAGLTGAAYRIVKRAIATRIEKGEEVEAVVRHYTKLSEEQMTELINEFTLKEAETLGTKEQSDN